MASISSSDSRKTYNQICNIVNTQVMFLLRVFFPAHLVTTPWNVSFRSDSGRCMHFPLLEDPAMAEFPTMYGFMAVLQFVCFRSEKQGVYSIIASHTATDPLLVSFFCMIAFYWSLENLPTGVFIMRPVIGVRCGVSKKTIEMFGRVCGSGVEFLTLRRHEYDSWTLQSCSTWDYFHCYGRKHCSVLHRWVIYWTSLHYFHEINLSQVLHIYAESS